MPAKRRQGHSPAFFWSVSGLVMASKNVRHKPVKTYAARMRLPNATGNNVGSDMAADALHGFNAVFPSAECGQTQVSFPARAESYTGCTHDIHIIEQVVEEFP